MFDLNMIDMVVVGLILFLSLKGMVNGFSKELFNFIGLIGGVYVASRVNTVVGEFVSSNIFPISHEPTLKLVGFIGTLMAIWMISNLVSSIFEKVLSEDVGILSRLLGYIITVVRYVAIFAIIIVSVQNIELISKKLETHSKDSQTIPALNEVGSILLNIEDRNLTAIEDSNESQKIDLNSFDLDQNDSNHTEE